MGVEEGLGASPSTEEGSRRKRGRPSRGNPKEEDVCFHCHDGGQLILCDRRPCPKVYHLHCTGRDAEFFQTTASWFCSWHYCSICMKTAAIQCYTCTNSYCKDCIKSASFIPIRKTRGLCEPCLELVKMIENEETVNSEGISVDFNDRETYEFLYKDYWEDMKKQFSLTWQEIYRSMEVNEAENKFVTGQSDNWNWSFKDRDASDKDWDEKKTIKWQQQDRRFLKSLTSDDDGESDCCIERDFDGKRIRSRRHNVKSCRSGSWASTELLGFVNFMGKDPKECLVPKVVSELLWSYIENNKLQDPEKRGQIICDERLKRLFGRQSVGQFEIRKLLKHHFTSKCEKVRKVANNMAGLEAGFVDASMDNERPKGMSKTQYKKRKSEKHRSTKYAAINVTNINLIYIKHSLLEDFLNDPASRSKIIGSFVRVPSVHVVGTTDRGYDIVQVTGIKHKPDCINTQQRDACFSLEVLIVQKQEQTTVEVAAGLISDRDFTEEECERLRQNIKLGLMPVMMVTDIEEKAKALHELKVKDLMKTELVKLCNLRDRANEKGDRKEVMECVEKLRLLRSSAERERRLREPITVMSDSDMDPSSCFPSQKHTSNNQAAVVETHMDIVYDAKAPVDNIQDGLQLLNDENTKMWHYHDPKSRVQGPFSMKQLRKWAMADLFPPGLQIWRSGSQDEVSLLRDVLVEKSED